MSCPCSEWRSSSHVEADRLLCVRWQRLPSSCPVAPDPGCWAAWPTELFKLCCPSPGPSILVPSIWNLHCFCRFHRWSGALPGLPISAWFLLGMCQCLFSGSNPPVERLWIFQGSLLNTSSRWREVKTTCQRQVPISFKNLKYNAWKSGFVFYLRIQQFFLNCKSSNWHFKQVAQTLWDFASSLSLRQQRGCFRVSGVEHPTALVTCESGQLYFSYPSSSSTKIYFHCDPHYTWIFILSVGLNLIILMVSPKRWWFPNVCFHPSSWTPGLNTKTYWTFGTGKASDWTCLKLMCTAHTPAEPGAYPIFPFLAIGPATHSVTLSHLDSTRSATSHNPVLTHCPSLLAPSFPLPRNQFESPAPLAWT